MRKNGESKLAKGLWSILSDNNVHATNDLADELNCSKDKVRAIIQLHRKRFNSGEEDTWVYLTRGGYTVDGRPEHVAYESRFRLAMGTGVIMNGMYVLKQMKRLAFKEFNGMMLEYKPKMLEMGKVIK